MKFAVLADIHGNSSALAAVLKDMERLGVDEAVNLGDHLSGPLDAVGSADLLMDRDFVTIRGNHDRWLTETDPSKMGASDKVAFEQLHRTHLDWLKAQPATRTTFDEVFLCHGTPTNDQTYWLERVDANHSVRSATLQEIEAEVGDISASLILCGHTHIPRIVRLRSGQVILNPGSIGCPGYDDDTPIYHQMQTGTPNASYAIAEKTGDSWSVTFRSVPYDSRPMIDLARRRGREEWARALETGWVLDH
jgi:putative phosphoesterase